MASATSHSEGGYFVLNGGERFDLSIFEDVRVDDYKCVKCHEISMDIYQTPCGHRLCHRCYSDIVTETKHGKTVACPAKEDICEEMSSKDQPQKDFAARKDLNKMTVKCPNHEYGCKEKTKLKHLMTHLKNECEYKVVPCDYANKGCSHRSLQSNMADHLRKCQYRPHTCQHCQSSVTFIDLQNHLLLCEEAPVQCPYNCKEQNKIKRKDLDHHLLKCPLAPKPCPFKRFGCDMKGSSEEIKKHMKNSQGNHLTLVIDHVDRANTAMNGDRDRVDATLLKLESRIAALREENIRFKNHITKAVESVQDQFQSTFSGGATESSGATDTLVPKDSSSNTMVSDKGNVMQNLEAALNFQLGMIQTKIESMQLQLKTVEVTSYDGGIIWRIDDYQRKLTEARNSEVVSIYSPTFYTSRYGYKMCARVYLNGDGDGKNTHISAFFVILRGTYDNLNKWPFDHKVTIHLLDQLDGTRDINYVFTPKPTDAAQRESFMKPTTEMNVASGLQKFVKHTTVEQDRYLDNDTIFLRIEVDKTYLVDPFDRRSGHEAR